MDFQSMMETFAEAWVAANVQTPLTEAVENVGRNNAATIKSSTNLPVHCLVERVSSPANNASTTTTTNTTLTGTSASSASMGTFDVLTGHTSGTTSSSSVDSTASSLANSLPVVVEQDTYAIIPSAVPFHDLVRTALLKLGYTSAEIVGAKGVIQLKNWKPLTFDQISDNSEATVADILGDISSVATLRIRLYSLMTTIPEWTQHTVREAVLELSREISQSKLSKLCQISQPLLSSIVNNKFEGKIGKKKCQEFGKWYTEYRLSQNKASSSSSGGVSSNESQRKSDNYSDETIDEKSTDLEPNMNQSSSSQSTTTSETRLTLHSSLEVPQLRQWFRCNPKPSDRLLLKYAELLNQSSLRQERNKVTVKSLKNWWKNERQREKKSLRNKAKQIVTTDCDTGIVSNVLLSTTCTSSDNVLTDGRGGDTSDDEPTLTLAFTGGDDTSDDHML